ncbi:MAG TPA: hypothetical protein VFE47_25345 [Tepidisphaeraceae bacterium]|jgi:hypothetical protein|nr:hypothetical protein [Tepidisphaeraceae bacterium]
MLPLLNAIYSHFTATLAVTFPSGLHRDQAPEGAAMPYVVSRIVSSKTELAYGPASRTTTQIKLSAFGIGHDATGALADQLTSAFDSTLLSLSSGTNDSVVRLGEPLPAIHSHDGQGNDVWEWAVVYEYGVVDT